MKFSYIALFLVLALIAAFAYAEDGSKGVMTVKLENKLTDEQLDSDAFWKFDGTFMESLYTTFTPDGEEDVSIFIQYALNKKAFEVTMFAAPGVELEKPDSKGRELILTMVNGLIPEAQNNKATSVSSSISKLDAECFDANKNIKPECAGGDGTCTKDDQCINFSVCVFTCTTDADCTEEGEVCIKEEGKTEGECGVAPEPVTCTEDADCTVEGETCIIEEGKTEGECGVVPTPEPVACTAENEAEVCADGEKCIIVGDATEGTCGVPDDDETPVECTAENEAEVCAEGEKCIIVGDATEGTCGVPDDDETPEEFRALQNEAKGKCSKREAKNSASATTVALTFAMTIAMAALMIA